MADERPWFPFHVERLTGPEAIQLLDDAQFGRYTRLLLHQWRTGSVPGTTGDLSRLLRCLEFDVPALLDLFPLGEDGRRRNAVLEAIRTEQDARIEAQRQGGRLSATNLNSGRSPANLSGKLTGKLDKKRQKPPANLTGTLPANLTGKPELRAISTTTEGGSSSLDSAVSQGGVGGDGIRIEREGDGVARTAPGPLPGDTLLVESQQVAAAANAGLLANPQLPPTAVEILRWDQAQTWVAQWRTAGISLETILATVREVAERYKPPRPGSRISSFAYFNQPILAAHEAIPAPDTSAPALRRITA